MKLAITPTDLKQIAQGKTLYEQHQGDTAYITGRIERTGASIESIILQNEDRWRQFTQSFAPLTKKAAGTITYKQEEASINLNDGRGTKIEMTLRYDTLDRYLQQ